MYGAVYIVSGRTHTCPHVADQDRNKKSKRTPPCLQDLGVRMRKARRGHISLRYALCWSQTYRKINVLRHQEVTLELVTLRADCVAPIVEDLHTTIPRVCLQSP